MMEIKTKRLELKNPDSHNKKRLIELIGDKRVSEMLCGVPYPFTNQDADHTLKIINNSELKFSIFLNDVLVGGIGLSPKDTGYCELMYWIGFEYWGKGFATESCFGLFDHVKILTPHKKFKALVYKGNTVSTKVLEKIGFKQMGDGEVFSISKQENISCLNYEYFL